MTDVTMTPPRFDMGRVVSRMFSAIGNNWTVLLLLAVVLTGLPQAAYQAVAFRSGWTTGVRGLAFNPALWSTAGWGWPILMIAGFVLQAALVYGVVADLNGRKASFGECLSAGVRVLLPVVAIGILGTIAVLFGLVLFIVPGVLMLLAWCVAVPAAVVERTGVFGSFSRSADLTRNHRGAIFGLVIAYMLVSMVIGGVLGGVIIAVFAFSGGYDGPGLMLTQIVSSLVVQPIQTLIATAGLASIYYELRHIKEGVGPEALAAIFD